MSSGFDDMLKNVLSDPGAMEKISSMLSSLGSSEEKQDPSAGSDGFGGMETLLKAKDMFEKVSKEDDPRLTLLNALKPYLNKKRITKVDSAIKILKVSKLAPLIKDFDIF
jgi:hypothetical protein